MNFEVPVGHCTVHHVHRPFDTLYHPFDTRYHRLKVCWWTQHESLKKGRSRKPSMIKDQWQSKIPGNLEEETVNPGKPSRLGVINMNIQHRQAQETASCKIPSQLSAPSASNERSICGKISILEVDASQLLGCWKVKSREREGPKGFS